MLHFFGMHIQIAFMKLHSDAQKRSTPSCQTLLNLAKERAREWWELLPIGPQLFVVEVGSILPTLQMNVSNIFPKSTGNYIFDH